MTVRQSRALAQAPALDSGMARRLLLLLALAACGPAPAPEPPSAPLAEPLPPPAGDPPTPFDAAEIVFDTTEPPEPTLVFPPRPAPPARPAPRPRPPSLPPAPPADAPSGSCDVRSTVGYCFAFVGPGWTPAATRALCDAAPSSGYGSGACPLDGRVATCSFEPPDALGREIVYTYYEPYDPALAELACPGRFTLLRDEG